MPKADFAATLRRTREARGLSQDALAEAAGLSADLVSRVERRRVSPTIGTAARLAAGLGVALADLVGDVEPMPADIAGRALLDALAAYIAEVR